MIIDVIQKSGGNSKNCQFPSDCRTMYALVIDAKIIHTLTIKSHNANFLGFIESGLFASSTIFISAILLDLQF